MKKEELEEMQVTKKKRQKMLIEAVDKHSAQTQEELVDILREHFGIRTNQAAVSRDIKELKIEWDKETNCYVLGTRARKNKEANKVARFLQQANVMNIAGEMSSLLLKGKPEYMPLIASQIEDLLLTDEIYVSSFVGHNGSLLIYFPKDKEVAVTRIMNQIFSHISK